MFRCAHTKLELHSSLFLLVASILAVAIPFFSLRTTIIRAASANLVPNSSLEQVTNGKPVSWSYSHSGNNAATFSIVHPGYTGNNAVKTHVTRFTSGDAKWFFTAQAILPDHSYKFTDYYQSNVVSHVVLVYTMKDGSKQYIGLGEYDPSSTWKNISGVFVTPVDATKLTIYHNIRGVGYLTTDDYSVTSVDSKSFTHPLVTLTFDDGLTTQYTRGLPVLKKYGLHGTFFIISGDIASTAGGYYMTASQISQIQQVGNRIGSHTVTHPYLTKLNDTQLANELSASKNTLQAKFGSVVDFASPYGDYNQRVIRFIRRYYRSHRSSDDGFNTRSTFNIYQIKVQTVLNTTPLSTVQSWIDQAKRDNTWLILEYHEIVTSNDLYSITPSMFTSQIQALVNSKVTVKTMDQAIAEISPQLS